MVARDIDVDNFLAQNAEGILDRLEAVVGSLKEYLEVSRQAIYRAKNSKVPMDWLIQASLDKGISIDWLLSGKGPRTNFERTSLLIFPWTKKAEKFKVHSLQRAKFIFDQGCADVGFPGSFLGTGEEEPIIKDYLAKKIDDTNLYLGARDWALSKIDQIRKTEETMNARGRSQQRSDRLQFGSLATK